MALIRGPYAPQKAYKPCTDVTYLLLSVYEMAHPLLYPKKELKIATTSMNEVIKNDTF
jgi:hypothetical protein